MGALFKSINRNDDSNPVRPGVLTCAYVSTPYCLAAGIICFSVNPSLGNQICKPHLTFKSIKLTDVQNLQRKWTAVLNVDASRCASDFGRFEIRFLREKENAPELEFTEQFTWQTVQLKTGEIEASVELWMDEAVHHYAVDYVAPCACRE